MADADQSPDRDADQSEDISEISPPRRLFFHGSGYELFEIWIVNLSYTLLTLGVYYFWAKVRVRMYLLSRLEFDDHPFVYHGTGKELLVGWGKATLVITVPLSLPILLNANLTIRTLSSLLVAGLTLTLFQFVRVWSHAYRLSRISWRSIRFSFKGTARQSIKIFAKGTLLTVITAGLYYPFYVTEQRRFMTSYSFVGNTPFEFSGRGRDVLKIYAQAVLLGTVWGVLLVLLLAFALFIVSGLVAPWLSPRMQQLTNLAMALLILGIVLLYLKSVIFSDQQRYFWSRTSVGTASFRSTMPTESLFWFKVANVGLLIASLGLAWPWVRTRNLRFFFDHFMVEGPIELADIDQQTAPPNAMGEEFTGFFEAGLDLG